MSSGGDKEVMVRDDNSTESAQGLNTKTIERRGNDNDRSNN